MKNRFTRVLAGIIATILLLSPVALMEGETDAYFDSTELGVPPSTDDTTNEEPSVESSDPLAESSDPIVESSDPVQDETVMNEDSPSDDSEPVADDSADTSSEQKDEIVIGTVDEVVKEVECDLGELDTSVSDLEYFEVDDLFESSDSVATDESGTLFAAESSYTVNGKQVYAAMVNDPGDGQCWAYANDIYKKIWGVNFDSSFAGSINTGYNSLVNLNDSDRTLTASHLQNFVFQAALGSVIRIGGCTSSCSHWNDDGLACGHKGHSLVIVAKSDTGFTTFERISGYGRREKTWTWDSFCNSYSSYPYIKYIKWPNASVYTTASNKPQYANLGDDFYALILNTNYWKAISESNSSVGVIIDSAPVNSAQQKWRFQRQEDGSYVISSCYDGNILEMDQGIKENGRQLTTPHNTFWNGAYQKWFLIPYNGAFVIQSCHFTNEKWVVDLCANSSVNGNPVQICERNNTSAQIWSIYAQDDVQLKGPQLSVLPGDSKTNTVFTWDYVFGARSYNVRVFKDSLWKGEEYSLWNTTSGSTTILPPGNYIAYVDAINYYEAQMGETVSFTVPDAKTESKTVHSDTTSTTTAANPSTTGLVVTVSATPSVKKPKVASKGKVTVSWKKIKTNKKGKALLKTIKNIEVQYSTDPTFATNVVSKTVGKKKTKITLKLQKKTQYYFRVRYIGNDGGVSKWSAVKKAKTKK